MTNFNPVSFDSNIHVLMQHCLWS